jgi:hypothetical protein
MNTRLHAHQRAWIEESVPAVDPEVVKGMWDFQERVSSLKGELTKPEDVSFALGLLQRSIQHAIKPEETNHSFNYRGAVLIQMVLLSQAGQLVVPGMENGKPSDALFKAISKVPMKADGKSFPPFDMKELVQLIEEEKGPCGPLG